MKSLSPADRYERAVAFTLNTIPTIHASRPKVGTSYSDVYVSRPQYGDATWIEVKMNEADQMGTPRVSYNGKKWTSTKKGPVQNFVCDKLNTDSYSRFILKCLEEEFGTDFVLPTTKGGLNHPNAISLEHLEDYFCGRDDNYIFEEDNVNLGALIREHYQFGKAEPADYISAGDNFYCLNTEDPFETNAPILYGHGRLRVRISFRSEFYEIMPEIKLRTMAESEYSIAPGTNKKNPFTGTPLMV